MTLEQFNALSPQQQAEVQRALTRQYNKAILKNLALVGAGGFFVYRFLEKNKNVDINWNIFRS